MASIRLISENGELVEQEVISREAVVSPDDQPDFEPAVVQTIEYDHKGQSSTITSTCGETENRRESDEEPDLTVEGILTEDQLQDAKTLKEGQEVTFVSDVHQGQVFVKRLTITQDASLNTYIENGNEELAFSFQLQLKQPE